MLGCFPEASIFAYSWFLGENFVVSKVYGISFSLGGHCISSFVFLPGLPCPLSLILTCENYIYWRVPKMFIWPLFFFSLYFPHFCSLFVSCVFSAGLCALRIRTALMFGRQRSIMSTDSGMWSLLVFEKQQEAFRPFIRKGEGVFNPQAVLSQPLVLANIFSFICLPLT